jgi:hypothetical protein
MPSLGRVFESSQPELVDYLLVTVAYEEIGTHFSQMTQIDMSNSMGAIIQTQDIHLFASLHEGLPWHSRARECKDSIYQLSIKTASNIPKIPNTPNMQTLIFLPSSFTFATLSFSRFTTSSS